MGATYTTNKEVEHGAITTTRRIKDKANQACGLHRVWQRHYEASKKDVPKMLLAKEGARTQG